MLLYSAMLLMVLLALTACSKSVAVALEALQCEAATSAIRVERNARSLIGPFDLSQLVKSSGRASPHRQPTPRAQSKPIQAEARRQPSRKSSSGRKPPAVGTPSASGPRASRRAVLLEGDVVLGGLFPVHRRGAGEGCGREATRGGVHALEAALYALDAAQALAPPGTRLGALLLDDCDDDRYGLEAALDFIKGSVGNIAEAEYACSVSRTVVSGVLGAASSVTSVRVANLLRLFKIPQVSFYATSPELSNKVRFEYFARTVPSDQEQAHAIVEVVAALGWRYVSVLYDNSECGVKAFEELEILLERYNICIAVKERLPPEPNDASYDVAVARLLTRPRARGVIVFAPEQEFAAVIAAVARCNATETFSWVGSAGWSGRAVCAGCERAVEGAVTVQPRASPPPGFADYFRNLTVENNVRNPWFVEFWEEQFQCRYPGGAGGAGGAGGTRYPRVCNVRRRLSAADVTPEPRLQFVADAVFAFAHAFRDMHAELCGGKPGLCDAMRPASGPVLLKHLRRVRFTGLSGDEFQFDGNGDGPARYDVLHYKRMLSGEYRWANVGHYLHGELQLHVDELRFRGERAHPPTSVCSADCAPGQARRHAEGDRCCWHCFNCSRYAVPVADTCVECALGSVPDATRYRCVPVPERHTGARSAAGDVASALAVLGLALTAGAAGVWIARGDTPVVRASARELSFVLLAGLGMCYLMTFALLSRPTDVTCALQRGGAGLCFTVVYAALLTKTDRIARIFAAGCVSARRPALISPQAQLGICAALVSVQALAVLCWQAARPARAVWHHASRDATVLVCDCHVDASATAGFLYPALLVAVCTALAVRTRNIPGAFNESKHIGFAMYTTCVIWLAFVPLYAGSVHRPQLRVAGIALAVALSASVALLCLFAPKMYIIVVRPERNVRARVRPAARRCGAVDTGGGMVRAALVGVAPAAQQRPRAHRHVQTDDSPLVLDARRLRTTAPPSPIRMLPFAPAIC